MRKPILIIWIILLFLIGACSPKEDSDTLKAKKLIDYNNHKYDTLPLTGKIVDGVREIDIKAFQFGWDPDTIIVKKGEKVRITVYAVDAQHGFELEGIQIPGWNTDTIIIKGDKKIIEFVPQEEGKWDMVCTVYCGPGHGEMKGKYIVRT